MLLIHFRRVHMNWSFNRILGLFEFFYLSYISLLLFVFFIEPFRLLFLFFFNSSLLRLKFCEIHLILLKNLGVKSIFSQILEIYYNEFNLLIRCQMR